LGKTVVVLDKVYFFAMKNKDAMRFIRKLTSLQMFVNNSMFTIGKTRLIKTQNATVECARVCVETSFCIGHTYIA